MTNTLKYDNNNRKRNNNKIIYEKEKHLSKINSPMILDFRAF